MGTLVLCMLVWWQCVAFIKAVVSSWFVGTAKQMKVALPLSPTRGNISHTCAHTHTHTKHESSLPDLPAPSSDHRKSLSLAGPHFQPGEHVLVAFIAMGHGLMPSWHKHGQWGAVWECLKVRSRWPAAQDNGGSPKIHVQGLVQLVLTEEK